MASVAGYSQTKRTINVEKAGTLPTFISDAEKYSIEELTLTGELNGTDFALIRDMAGCNLIQSSENLDETRGGTLSADTDGKLRILDLTDAKIVSGGDPYISLDEKVGGILFDNRAVKVGAPESVKPIESYGFARGMYYTKDDEIGDCLFYACRALDSVILPSTITIIGNKAFENCCRYKGEDGIAREDSELYDGLSSIEIPKGVITIGINAFHFTRNLHYVSLPASLMKIGENAFFRASLLEVKSYIKEPFYIPTPPPFQENYPAILYVPTGTKEKYEALDGWVGWASFKEVIEDSSLDGDEEEVIEYIEDGIVYTPQTNGTAYVSSVRLTTESKAEIKASVTIDGTEYAVTEIKANVFVGNTNITDIYLPDTEETLILGENALKIDDKSIAAIHVPLSLLDDYALHEQLKQNFEADKISAAKVASNQYWTFSCGVDVLVPEGVTLYACQLKESGAVITEVADDELTVSGKKVIKANNGILIASTDGKNGKTYELVAHAGRQKSGTIPSTTNANDYKDNHLEPVIDSAHYDPSQYYMLYQGQFVTLANNNAKTPACRALLKK